jgi:hypothetical protein
MVNKGIKAMASKFKGSRPKSKMLSKSFRAAGMKNYMERTSMLPAARQTAYSIGAPQFNRGKPIIIAHREYLQPVITTAAFDGTGRYIIQPGLVDNFPWLGQIAGAFENYRFRKLNYVYRSRAGSNTAITVYTAFQYDVTDPEFSSVEDMMTYAGARSEVAWQDFSVNAMLNRGRMMRKYLTRTDALAAGQDAQLYDSALFTISCISATTAAGFYAGDLLVEYEIEFWNPKQNPNFAGAYGASSGFFLTGVAAQTTPLQGYNAAKTTLFPTAADPIVDEAKNTITFPQVGAYDIGIHAHGAGGTQTTRFTMDNTDGKATVSDLSSTSSAGGGTSDWAKVLVNVAGAAIRVQSIITNPNTNQMDMWVAIAAEAVTFVLDFQSKNPSLVVTDEQLANLKRHHAKRDLSKFVLANQKWQRRREEKRRTEIIRDSLSQEPMEVVIMRDENSDEDGVQAPPRSRSTDRRSKSSERKS